MQDHSKDPVDDDPVAYPDVAVLVIDAQHARWSPNLDDWNAATLLACLSEDPADWSEIAAVWPRYQTGPSAEFADSLSLSVTESDAVLPQLLPEEPWVVLDLQQRRLFSSPGYGEVQRDSFFGMGPDHGFGPAIRMLMHLPPWWEIHNGAGFEDISQPRASEICRPTPRRDVLWGRALAAGLAERLLAVYQSEEWTKSAAATDADARYPLTVRVHRDWLMTPREDLEGRLPRQCLHGGIEWIDRVIEGQQWNVTDIRNAIPIPRDLLSYAEAPMGRSEVSMYFDACREMIEAGWEWMVDHAALISSTSFQEITTRLAGVLEQVQSRWMHAPFEGGSPPISIIQSERERIPRLASGGEAGHMIDCDCPICQMMSEGSFGPCFVDVDGHHLDLDNEFAFSLCETREQWETQQQEFSAMSAAIGTQMKAEQEHAEPPDEFASAWQNPSVPEELPGDPMGHLALSFRLAEMIDAMKARNAAQADIDALNQGFRDYRRAEYEQRQLATARFKTVLERMTQRHESLVSCAADLQSQLDEHLRRFTADDIDDPGF